MGRLLHAAVHANFQGGCPIQAGFERLHRADVVHGSSIGPSLLTRELLEHPPAHIILELLVELAHSPVFCNLTSILLIYPLAC